MYLTSYESFELVRKSRSAHQLKRRDFILVIGREFALVRDANLHVAANEINESFRIRVSRAITVFLGFGDTPITGWLVWIGGVATNCFLPACGLVYSVSNAKRRILPSDVPDSRELRLMAFRLYARQLSGCNGY